jgi:hypothetical protein
MSSKYNLMYYVSYFNKHKSNLIVGVMKRERVEIEYRFQI